MSKFNVFIKSGKQSKNARKYPTPRDLIDYLLEGDKRKAKNQFRNVQGGRCCLGHYADMCGLDYDSTQSVFERLSPISENEVWAALPKDHWLFTTSLPEKVRVEFCEVAKRDMDPEFDTVQDTLAGVNDATQGFKTVIKALEVLDKAGVK